MNDKLEKSSRQYLTFKLAQETYALDIDKVREILDWSRPTRVPRCPDFMRGVINVRGGVVAVIDLPVKFGMNMTEKSIDTCIIITEITQGDDTVVLGVLADSVQEVIDLPPETIEPAPKIGTHLDTECILGIGKRDDNFIIILDINRIFSQEELSIVTQETSQECALGA